MLILNLYTLLLVVCLVLNERNEIVSNVWNDSRSSKVYDIKWNY